MNRINEGIASDILKFADDTNIFEKVESVESVNKLMIGQRVLCDWYEIKH